MWVSRALLVKFTGKETQADNECFVKNFAKSHTETVAALFFEVDEVDLFLEHGRAVLELLTSLACLACRYIKASSARTSTFHVNRAQLSCVTYRPYADAPSNGTYLHVSGRSHWDDIQESPVARPAHKLPLCAMRSPLDGWV